MQLPPLKLKMYPIVQLNHRKLKLNMLYSQLKASFEHELQNSHRACVGVSAR